MLIIVLPFPWGLSSMAIVDSAATASASRRITWVDPPGSFVGLSLLNALLRVLTLGIYHFWGKTEVRQRIWSAVRIDGEPLEYRGTGSELFKGFIIIFLVVLVPLSLLSVLPTLLGATIARDSLFQILLFLVGLVLVGLGMFRARRYRLSRTRWRGIRGGLSGNSGSFAWTYVWTTILIPFTLGWIVPWRAARLQSVLFNETQFGDKSFTFTGQSGPLYARYWLVWVSAIVLYFVAIAGVVAVMAAGADWPPPQGVPPPPPTGGQIAGMTAIIIAAFFIFALIRAWYSSRMFNYFATQTKYQGCGFHLRTTVPSLVWLVASNYLMRLLSLGVLTPVTEARSMRYIVERLTIEGEVDWPAVGQNPAALMKRGEGLAEAFDVDAF
jgi:uncharacterized membrane protein YjgN (DUF898 family)